MRPPARAILILLIAVASGCGGGDGGDAPRASAHGRQIFTERCGSCHAFKDARAKGGIGPNLDEIKPDEDAVRDRVTNGGGAMPAFKGQLSDADIGAVAEYVSENAGGGG
jgi:mono/diheme cytochrome c family protein